MADEQDPTILPLVTGNGRTLATADITALLGLINQMLSSMEGRIIEVLRINSDREGDRWKQHDAEHLRTVRAIEETIRAVRDDLNEHIRVANIRVAKQHDIEVGREARVKPVVSTFRWLIANWPKAIAFVFSVAFVILGFLAILGDWLERYLGGVS